jgi:hypothetical protein
MQLKLKIQDKKEISNNLDGAITAPLLIKTSTKANQEPVETVEDFVLPAQMEEVEKKHIGIKTTTSVSNTAQVVTTSISISNNQDNNSFSSSLNSISIKGSENVMPKPDNSKISEKVTDSFNKLKEGVASYRNNKNTDSEELTNSSKMGNKMLVINPVENLKSVSDYVKPTISGVAKKVVTTIFDPLHIISYLIGITACILFVYTALSEKIFFLKMPALRLERVTLISFAIMLFLDLLLVFFITRKAFKGFYIYLALFTLQTSCFLYAFRLNGVQIASVNNISITTNWSLAILPFVIFMQCLGIIQNKNRLWLNIIQCCIIFAQLFGTVNLLNDLYYDPNLQANSIYKFIRGIPVYVWTTFSTIAIAILTSYGFKKKLTYFFFTFIVMFPIINLILLTKSQTYWYQTILALIIWDLLYNPILEIDTESTDVRVLPKLIVSGVYHVVLFLAILLINGYLNVLYA